MRHTPRTSASVLTGALVVLALLAGCSDDGGGEADDTSTPAARTADPSTDDTTSSPGDATESSDDDGTAVPVYYVGDTPHGPRLYREFNRVSGMDPLVGTAAAVTTGDAVDPDYRTLWPGGRFAAVTKEDGAIVVELPDDGWLTSDLEPKQAQLAVQQLVYSLQGAAGERLPVRPELDGEPAATLLGVDASKGLRAAPELDVLALVNVTEPAEGTAVPDRFLAEGRASSFEGTVIWEIQDSAGKVVLDGWANAGGWDKLYPWEKRINVSNLPAGDYTFVARTDDPSDGEGPGPTEDTKHITVQ